MIAEKANWIEMDGADWIRCCWGEFEWDVWLSPVSQDRGIWYAHQRVDAEMGCTKEVWRTKHTRKELAIAKCEESMVSANVPERLVVDVKHDLMDK